MSAPIIFIAKKNWGRLQDDYPEPKRNNNDLQPDTESITQHRQDSEPGSKNKSPANSKENTRAWNDNYHNCQQQKADEVGGRWHF
jgi:hypothetical protein